MKKVFWTKFIVITAVATLFNACASTTDYAQFGKTGQSYAQAINKLLDATKKVSIDSSSEKLLRNRATTPQERERYYKRTKMTDQEWLDLLSQMQVHTNLLSKYFERLQALATSDSPQRAQDETEKLVGNLSMIGNKIRTKTFFQTGGVLPPIANLVVKAHVRSSLKAELQVRQATIQAELVTQEKVLALIKDELKRQLTDLQKNQEERLLYKPYVNNPEVPQADLFVSDRSRILTLSTTIPELDQATTVSGELKNAFSDLIDGKLNLARVNLLLSDIQSLLEVAQQLKTVNEKPPLQQ
ncbi:MAG: hypothetical protein PUP93_22210 [Rhizonema sp. NSF051]|nr:hypothetical protein [Rhizonema sp. NSF051]